MILSELNPLTSSIQKCTFIDHIKQCRSKSRINNIIMTNDGVSSVDYKIVFFKCFMPSVTNAKVTVSRLE